MLAARGDSRRSGPGRGRGVRLLGATQEGDLIVVAGTFSGDDVDDDGVLEHPNNLLELVKFNSKSTYYPGNGTTAKYDLGYGHLDAFTFHPSGPAGLVSLEAHKSELLEPIGEEQVCYQVMNQGHGYRTSSTPEVDTDVLKAPTRTRPEADLLFSTRSINDGFNNGNGGDGGIETQLHVENGNSGYAVRRGLAAGAVEIEDVGEFFRPWRHSANPSGFGGSAAVGTASPSPLAMTTGQILPTAAGGAPRSYCSSIAAGAVRRSRSLYRDAEWFSGLHGGTPAGDVSELTGGAMLRFWMRRGPVAVTVEAAFMMVANPLTRPELAADFNSDGQVDGSDFLIWQRSFGNTSSAGFADGDADGDGP